MLTAKIKPNLSLLFLQVIAFLLPINPVSADLGVDWKLNSFFNAADNWLKHSESITDVFREIEDIPTEGNVKDMSRYSPKEVFILSDNDWKDILQLVPASVWTNGDGSATKFPILAYHQEGDVFDADSLIYFLQQYQPDKVTVMGSKTDGIAETLMSLFLAESPFGAGLHAEQINFLDPRDYTGYLLGYWQNYDNVVYSENDYETALISSTYASLLNSPLIIGSYHGLSNLFTEKKVICIGEGVFNPGCAEGYSVEEIQQRYADLTKTDKIILVNPLDLNIFIDVGYKDEKTGEYFAFTPEKTQDFISRLYTKTSLFSPILASGKHELLLTTSENEYGAVDNFLDAKLSALRLHPKYLTIMAAPNSIDFDPKIKIRTNWNKEDADFTFYGNTDADPFFELSVGRIFSLTSSDVSSYVARDLFYGSIPHSNEFAMLYNNAEFPRMKSSALFNDRLLSEAGFVKRSVYTDNLDTPKLEASRDLPGKFFINYVDHGDTWGWVGINTNDIKDENVWLSPSIVVSDACLTCAFGILIDKDKPHLFCTNILRRGALGHIGSIDITNTRADPSRFLLSHAMGSTIGESLKKLKNTNLLEGGDDFTLLGDPTISFDIQYPDMENEAVYEFSPGQDEAHKTIVITIPLSEGMFQYSQPDDDPDDKQIPASSTYYEEPAGRIVNKFMSSLELGNPLEGTEDSIKFDGSFLLEEIPVNMRIVSVNSFEVYGSGNQPIFSPRSEVVYDGNILRFSNEFLPYKVDKNIDITLTQMQDNEDKSVLVSLRGAIPVSLLNGVIKIKIPIEFEQASQNPRCPDLTRFNECSARLEYFCDNGDLLPNCTVCGCPHKKTCAADGTCQE